MEITVILLIEASILFQEVLVKSVLNLVHVCKTDFGVKWRKIYFSIRSAWGARCQSGSVNRSYFVVFRKSVSV